MAGLGADDVLALRGLRVPLGEVPTAVLAPGGRLDSVARVVVGSVPRDSRSRVSLDAGDSVVGTSGVDPVAPAGDRAVLDGDPREPSAVVDAVVTRGPRKGVAVEVDRDLVVTHVKPVGAGASEVVADHDASRDR